MPANNFYIALYDSTSELFSFASLIRFVMDVDVNKKYVWGVLLQSLSTYS